MKISLSNTIGIYRKPKNGWNSAQVRLLKKSTSQPSAYAGSEVIYTFATGAVSFASGNDGWSVTPPSGDGDLYAIFASAATQENSDTIQPNEWTAPVVLSEEAVAGQDGYNVCTVFIYQRGESAPSLPSATVTYTFEGGAISGLSNGWTKNIPDGETTIWISSATAFSRTSSDTILASEWSEARIFAKKGDQGIQGIQGVQGEKGDQGIQGNTGANGASAFFHIKYSNSMNPSSSADMNDTGGAYIGTYVDSIQADSSNPADYTWVLVKGSQGEKGDQGIAGTNGENGVTSYLHIKYADVASPTDAQINDVSGEYIGTYVGTEINDPPYASWYKWVKIKGNKGDQGADAVQVNVFSTTGSAFRETDANLSGVITAQVMQGMSDITSTIEDFRFNWKRISASENPADDESWNTSSKAIGHKSISITNNDCIGRTVFICEVDIQGE